MIFIYKVWDEIKKAEIWSSSITHIVDMLYKIEDEWWTILVMHTTRYD